MHVNRNALPMLVLLYWSLPKGNKYVTYGIIISWDLRL